MLKITIPGEEMFDYETQTFSYGKDTVLQLEHSLVSISKWESKWHIPYLSDKDKTIEQTLDYIKCMTLTQNVDDKVYERITNDNIKEITDYINDPMTATWFGDSKNAPPKRKRSGKVMTNELIYYQMIALDIPVEICQKWHLNRLLTLIKVCDEENKPKDKRKARDISADYAKLNAMRKAKLHTKG